MNITQEVIEIIKNRRNTKAFTDSEVPDEDIKILLDAAVWAPNHRNTEPWRFVVIRKNAEMKSRIAEGLVRLQEKMSDIKLPEDHKQLIYDGVFASPTLIFVFSLIGDTDEITEENYGAVCCAIQNIQLVAESMDLSVGWSTGRMCKISNLDEIFGITEEGLKIAGVLTVGYAEPTPNKTRINYEELTKWF